MATSKGEFDVYFGDGEAEDGQYNFDFQIAKHLQMAENLRKLKIMREAVVTARKRNSTIDIATMHSLIENWQGRYPDLGKLLSREDMDRLLVDCRNSEDVPELGADGKPLLLRTTALHRSIKNVHCDANSLSLSKLFEIYDKFHVNYVDEDGLTHFHVACEFGCARVVERFLERGQDPDCLWTKTGDSPLHTAMKRGHKRLIELLMRGGAIRTHPIKTDSLLCTNFARLISTITRRRGYFSRSALDLREKRRGLGKDILRDEQGPRPLLSLAVEHCSKGMVELLLRNGANPNSIDVDGFAPLHTMCKRDDDGLLEVFLEVDNDKHRLRIDIRDSLRGNTPLHYALVYARRDMLRLLLRNGADPRLTNAVGNTALHVLCQGYDDDDQSANVVFSKINGEGVDSWTRQVDARDNEGNTPLHLALRHSHEKLAEFLLSHGADPNLANGNGSTPLHIICQRGSFVFDDNSMETFFEICERVDRRLLLDSQDKRGRTPLQWAVASLLPEAVDVLLDHGADLSGFAFPSLTRFDAKAFECKNPEDKLLVASSMLMVVQRLENRGYELGLDDALQIMKLFDENEVFGASSDLDEQPCYDDEEFASQAKKIMLKADLSLLDLIQLRPERAAKLLKYEDYFKLWASGELQGNLSERHRKACARHLCEKLVTRFFQRSALYPLQQLLHHRLAILCCDMIVERLSNRDLYHICLARMRQISSSFAAWSRIGHCYTTYLELFDVGAVVGGVLDAGRAQAHVGGLGRGRGRGDVGQRYAGAGHGGGEDRPGHARRVEQAVALADLDAGIAAHRRRRGALAGCSAAGVAAARLADLYAAGRALDRAVEQARPGRRALLQLLAQQRQRQRQRDEQQTRSRPLRLGAVVACHFFRGWVTAACLVDRSAIHRQSND
ncbi:unnamed protein product [Trichogramma brassicae]|uniref:Uncharacterized protein n=1 Tax=Trichogramma brassicae TaxID=86971 RepID=A0A6H5I4B6_9HYME|nr:unnamed protein product [Trichogramma brassicae]